VHHATGRTSLKVDVDLIGTKALLHPMQQAEDHECWLLVREDTGEQMGPYAAYDDALQAAEIAGPEWKVIPQL
jgi:hypothetical protein